MAWSDEQKQKVIAMYQERNPTPDTSTEIIKEIADELELSPNGVRMVLVQNNVYVKKDPAAAPAKAGAKSAEGKTPRVSKEDSINALRKAIEAKDKEIDDEILGKLTGKAAIYFTSLLSD
jgi:transposase-like protein